ncbi:hypothetical protein [[Eubacterium] cellulosolvens]
MNRKILSFAFIIVLLTSIQASILVSGNGPFDFSITLSPYNQSVEQGGTAQYYIYLTYSDPSYSGTVINIVVSGLHPTMTYSTTMTGGLSITTSSSTPPTIYYIEIVGSALGVTHQTSATLVVTEKFDYSVEVNPPSQTVNIGGITTYSIAVQLMSGTSKPVSLSLTGLPGDIHYTFSVLSNNPTYTSILTIDTSGSTSAGTYTLTITATGGGKTETTTATLIVKGAPDFGLQADPNSATIKQGEKASFEITVKPIDGFDNLVTLSTSGLPSGATPFFTVPSGKPLFISTLRIETSLSTPIGNYPISVDAAGGGKTHSTTVTLKVEKRPRQPTSLSISASSQGGRIRVTGSVTPALDGEVSILYQGPDGRSVTHKATIDSDGGFSDTYTPDTYGDWSVSAGWPGNERYEESTSQKANITVEETFDIQSFLSNPTNLLLIGVAILALIAIILAARRK